MAKETNNAADKRETDIERDKRYGPWWRSRATGQG